MHGGTPDDSVAHAKAFANAAKMSFQHAPATLPVIPKRDPADQAKKKKRQRKQGATIKASHDHEIRRQQALDDIESPRGNLKGGNFRQGSFKTKRGSPGGAGPGRTKNGTKLGAVRPSNKQKLSASPYASTAGAGPSARGITAAELEYSQKNGPVGDGAPASSVVAKPPKSSPLVRPSPRTGKNVTGDGAPNNDGRGRGGGRGRNKAGGIGAGNGKGASGGGKSGGGAGGGAGGRRKGAVNVFKEDTEFGKSKPTSKGVRKARAAIEQQLGKNVLALKAELNSKRLETNLLLRQLDQLKEKHQVRETCLSVENIGL